MFSKSKQVIEDLKRIQDEETNNIWADSEFESLNDLKIDYSGKVGESVFFPYLKENTDWDIVFLGDSNTNSDDGTYDGIVNGKRVEVKTARLGKSPSKSNKYGGNFQHENLKNTKECDFVVFMDYKPNEILLTIEDFTRVNLDDTLINFGIKAHKRKNTENYKLDLKESTSIKKAQSNGISIKINSDTTSEDVITFLSKFIGK